MASSNNWITGGIILGSIVALAYAIPILMNTQKKSAPAGTVDSFQQSTFDERELDYSSTVVENMMARPRSNVILNEMYGGVPPVTVSDMTSYITGEWM